MSCPEIGKYECQSGSHPSLKFRWAGYPERTRVATGIMVSFGQKTNSIIQIKQDKRENNNIALLL